ncbi:hypothetical protein [Actinoplanes sp. NPDC049681]|uniref:hypothetical protein n=1 Tax=Actinoplanes sp. NPDC049681 TaxID=3363905 RepID=UPI00379EDCE9
METVTLDVRVLGAGLEPERVQESARDLRTAILTTDVDDAKPAPAGPAPAGAKSGDALSVGALVVTLAPSIVEALMGVVASWLSRQPGDIEIEIEGHRLKGHVTRAQRDELVAAYLSRLDAAR